MDKLRQITFSGLEEEDTKKPFSFSCALTLDRLFIYAIIALIVLVLVYSLGVEQGKRSTAQRIERTLRSVRSSDVAQAVVAALPEKPAVPAVPEPRTEVAPLTVAKPSSVPVVTQTVAPAKSSVTSAPAVKGKSFYYVQVISYTKVEDANQEVSKLKAQGMNAYINKRGQYNAVVVGNFSKREEADKALVALRKQYKDPFIRRKER